MNVTITPQPRPEPAERRDDAARAERRDPTAPARRADETHGDDRTHTPPHGDAVLQPRQVS
jgi:hypothetical protein